MNQRNFLTPSLFMDWNTDVPEFLYTEPIHETSPAKLLLPDVPRPIYRVWCLKVHEPVPFVLSAIKSKS